MQASKNSGIRNEAFLNNALQQGLSGTCPTFEILLDLSGDPIKNEIEFRKFIAMCTSLPALNFRFTGSQVLARPSEWLELLRRYGNVAPFFLCRAFAKQCEFC
jgi:hypothetical protein